MSDFEAKCTEFKEMKFDDRVVGMPFRCSPTLQTKKCQLFFNIDEEDEAYTLQGGRSFVTNECKCSLDGDKASGYCASTVGTEKYGRAMLAKKIMLENSSCHTLDRENMLAQKDETCGIGLGSEQWRYAVDQAFNMTYWPYIQNPDTYMCIRRFFSDSYDNMILSGATQLGLGIFTIAAIIEF